MNFKVELKNKHITFTLTKGVWDIQPKSLMSRSGLSAAQLVNNAALFSA